MSYDSAGLVSLDGLLWAIQIGRSCCFEHRKDTRSPVRSAGRIANDLSLPGKLALGRQQVRIHKFPEEQQGLIICAEREMVSQ